MKNSVHLLFLSSVALVSTGVALAIPLAPKATLLVGFSGFTSTIGQQDSTVVPGNYVDPLLTAGVTKARTGSATGGDTDGTYGTYPVSSLKPTSTPGSDNGYIRLSSINNTLFSVYASGDPGTTSYALDSLLFDLAVQTSNATATIRYQTFDQNGIPGPIQNLATEAVSHVGPGGNYDSFVVDLSGQHLVIGADASVGHIDFLFTGGGSTNAMYLDNIGLVVVPEPGSLLALGCVVGSGVFLRSRRRGPQMA